MTLSLTLIALVPTACQPQAFEASGTIGPLVIDDLGSCPPQMVQFPVGDAHNIGYDHGSCGTGTCDISCPDLHANSDWGGDHHGIDVFAYQGAPLVAVADGEVVAVGTPSSTSGLRVRLQDACGWEYYYGHMDEAFVREGQWVQAGDLLGTMGYTGTSSTHLHFNVSEWGDYYDDIDPFDLLYATSATACGASPAEPESSTTGSGGDSSSSGSSGSSSGSGGSTGDAGTDTPDASGGDMGTCGWATGTTYLFPDETLWSCDGRFVLVMQGDGNLVLYTSDLEALWHSGTHGYSGAWAAMQDDGNLVVYTSSGSALWASHTQGHPGAVLWVQDDGNLVIYDGPTAIWHTGTHGH